MLTLIQDDVGDDASGLGREVTNYDWCIVATWLIYRNLLELQSCYSILHLFEKEGKGCMM